MALSPLFTRISIIGLRNYSSACIHLNDPYIISAVRTPIGAFQGKLSSLTAVQLGTKALSAAVEKSGIPKDEIQEFVMGCALQSGLGQAPARQVAVISGLPSSVIASSINKVCASGMKAIMFASQVILSNTQEVVAVGGVESLSNVPLIFRRKNIRVGNVCMPDSILHDALYDFLEQVDCTSFAEITAKEYSISRQDQDAYGVQSYSKACEAANNGCFSDEIVPVVLKKKGKDDEVVCEDEEIKKLDLKKYYDLKPEMGANGTVTAGNSSSLADGAAMMIIANGNYVLKKNLTPLARIVSFADGALDAKKFCLAPSVAIPRALVKANLTTENISMWEISETFSLTPLVNMKLLRLDPSRVNIHGGSVSLGHPFGMTGARIVTHLAHALPKGEFGCAAISHGSGGASAVILEKF